MVGFFSFYNIFIVVVVVVPVDSLKTGSNPLWARAVSFLKAFGLRRAVFNNFHNAMRFPRSSTCGKHFGGKTCELRMNKNSTECIPCMNMQVCGFFFLSCEKRWTIDAVDQNRPFICGFIHNKTGTVEKTVDKFNDFNGFLQVFHRNPKGASFCHGKTVENLDFRPIIPLSFPQLHVLHIINRILHVAVD